MSVPRSERLPANRIASHVGVMLAVAAVMGVVVAGLAIPFAGLAGIGARNLATTMDSLPAELKTEALAQKTRIVDAHGDVIASLYDENRINVPLDQISRTMVKAIVAIEDYRFYQHGALDLKGTLRALVTNQASGGAVTQGGSSITQQMVKLTLLSQAKTKQEKKDATADTYARKIRELRYAIAFEQHYSKDWILERYLNIAYFGDGAYGIQAAARHYFGVNAKDLDLRQSAVLAGLVKNPTGYDPTNSPDRAIERRNVVLDRMAELNVISHERATKVKKKGLGLHVVASKNGCVFSRAPFFCDYVINTLLKDPSLGRTPEERKRLLYSGGLTIRTTIDLRDQDAADASVRSHVYPTDQAIGALAMVEPRTGDVKAIAQSRPMGRNRAAGETYLNYVVPHKYGDANGFQAGSTFKAFVLATAINDGIPLSTSFESPPEKVMPYSAYADCDGNPLVGGVWDVHNSTDSGLMNMYTGTQLSVNTFYAQLEAKTGVCKPYELAKQLGIHLTDPTNQMVPSFTLGVVDVDPLTMAAAYATWAGRGLYCKPRPITSIEDSGGNTLKSYSSECKQVVPSTVADAVNDILRGVQEGTGFGASQGLQLDKPSAAKTGTTNDNKAVWFIGYTPALATASMVAGANQLGQPISLNGQVLGGTYTASAHGSTTAGPMWGDAMHAIMQFLPSEDFVKPSAQDVQGVLTAVPDVAGMDVSAAEQALQQAGFQTSLGGYQASSYPTDSVAYTYPSAGTQFPSGDTVTIYQSTGHPPQPQHHSGGGGGGGTGGGGGGGGNGGGGKGHGHH
ncbi:MAG: penicillin-binding protein [Nocardioides sp.]